MKLKELQLEALNKFGGTSNVVGTLNNPSKAEIGQILLSEVTFNSPPLVIRVTDKPKNCSNSLQSLYSIPALVIFDGMKELDVGDTCDIEFDEEYTTFTILKEIK